MVLLMKGSRQSAPPRHTMEASHTVEASYTVETNHTMEASHTVEANHTVEAKQLQSPVALHGAEIYPALVIDCFALKTLRFGTKFVLFIC